MSTTRTETHDTDGPGVLTDTRPAAVIGAGSIGAAFALLFAASGRRVRVHDPDAGQLGRLRESVGTSWRMLREAELASGSESDLQQNITLHKSLADAVADAGHVQECAPEQLELKRTLFAQIEAAAPADAVLASSSSALLASEFAANLTTRERCLVAHPGNPPFLLRIIELVPAPFTTPAAVTRARSAFAAIGLSAIVLGREVRGFVFNRLQGAVLREAYCLVRDGVASVDDIDRIVREGLGLRWSVIGPFETVDLNTRGGIASHAQKLGPAYAAMGAERGQNDPWTPDLVEKVTAQRRALLPLERWEARVRWRDRELARVVAARRKRTSD